MMDRIKFAVEMANELNKANFGALTPLMVEDVTAAATQGVSCGSANMLADVYCSTTKMQYSVKSYKDSNVKKNMEGSDELDYTSYIIERRIAGVSNPNGDPVDVMREILADIYHNEERSKNYYGAETTTTLLVGHTEDEEYFYFRVSEFDYTYSEPVDVEVKYFTERSSNFMVHEGNRTEIIGYNEDNVPVYKWVHPNTQTFTRCLLKKYDLRNADSYYFKVKKQHYNRPSDDILMGMIFI